MNCGWVVYGEGKKGFVWCEDISIIDDFVYVVCIFRDIVFDGVLYWL